MDNPIVHWVGWSIEHVPTISYEGGAVHLAIDAQPKSRNNFDNSVSHLSSAYCVVQLKLCQCVMCSFIPPLTHIFPIYVGMENKHILLCVNFDQDNYQQQLSSQWSQGCQILLCGFCPSGGFPPPPFMDKKFGKEGVMDLGGTSLNEHNFQRKGGTTTPPPPHLWTISAQ